MVNTANYLAAAAARNEAEILDGDMRPGDLIDALERLKFGGGLRVIKVDASVRDYLVAALRRKNLNHACPQR